MKFWGSKKRAEKYIDAVSKYVKETYESFSSNSNNQEIIRYALSENYTALPTDENDATSVNFALINAAMKKYRKSRENFDLKQALVKASKPTFVDEMLLHMRQKNLSEPKVYKAAHIDRRLFSKIASNKTYRPSKDTAIAIAIAMELDLDETVALLSRAGYALSHSIKRDIIIEYFIRNRIFDLFELNDVLYSMHEKPFR